VNGHLGINAVSLATQGVKRGSELMLSPTLNKHAAPWRRSASAILRAVLLHVKLGLSVNGVSAAKNVEQESRSACEM
jgi:hypothetical protein